MIKLHIFEFQGLVLPIFESSGTETANYATLFIFHLFSVLLPLRLIKTHSNDNFSILMHFEVFLTEFVVYKEKNDEYLHTHQRCLKSKRVVLHNKEHESYYQRC